MLNPTRNIKIYQRKPYAHHSNIYEPFISSVSGRLGSGILDANNSEIFEGDIVQLVGTKAHRAPVNYRDACFWLDDIPLGNFADDDLIVVGHIAEV